MPAPRRSVLATSCALLVVLATGTAPAGAAPAPIAVTGTAASNRPLLHWPAAGSSQLLAYVEYPTTLAASLTDDTNDADLPDPPQELVARDAGGRTIRLGPVVAFSQHGTGDALLAGGDVVAAEAPGQRTDPLAEPHHVELWDVGSGQHASVTVPKGELVLTAAPGGLLVAAGDQIRLRGFDGQVITQATPFPGHTITSAVADRGRYVVTDGTEVATATFADFAAYRALAPGASGPVRCDSVGESGAGCRVAGGRPAYLPLDGSPATVASHNWTVQPVAATSDGIRWIEEPEDDRLASSVESLTAGASTPVRGPSVGGKAVPAYGELAVADPRTASDEEDLAPYPISITDGPTGTTVVVPAAPSPESAASFALTPTRIVYTSDLIDPSRPQRRERVRTASVAASATTVRIGARKDVAGSSAFTSISPSRGTRPTLAATVAIGGSTIAYSGCTKICRVRVRTGARTLTLPTPSSRLDDLAVSKGLVVITQGHRVGARDRSVTTYDVRTHRIRRYLVGASLRSNVVLVRGRLVYVAPGGLVKAVDLRTRRTRTLYRPSAALRSVQGTVAASGSWVSWSVDGWHGKHAVAVNRIRNLATGRTISVARHIYQLTGRGALLASTVCDPWCDDQAIYYRPFSSSTARALLPAQGFQQLPQLHGHVLAWIDAGGVLRARAH